MAPSSHTKGHDASHHHSSKTKGDMAPSSQAKGHDASHQHSSKTKGMAPSQTKGHDASNQHSSKTKGMVPSSQAKGHDVSQQHSSKTKGTAPSSQAKGHDAFHKHSSKTKGMTPSSQAKGQDASNQHSSKTKGKKSGQEEGTALEKHVGFFDRNKDGVVYPWETYQGFRAIGVGRLMSALSGVFINMGLSHKTRPGKGFSPLFPIEVKNSRLGIHGSDTDVYDKDGRFVESKFEEIFKKHAHTHQNALTSKEIQQLLKTNREPKDFEGWISAFLEWKILHQLCKDKNGLLSKEKVRGVYDGSLFVKMEKDRLEKLSRAKN